VLMDEQVDGQPPACDYIPAGDPASYQSFAHRKFLDALSQNTGVSLPVVKPDLRTIDSFVTPINLLVLALGVKGNFANVMPGTPLSQGWHIAKLIDEFRVVHTEEGSASYAGAKFRDFGMSLGPQQVLAADEIVVIVSGPKKRLLYKQLVNCKEFNPEFPLSVIYHPNIHDRVTLYATTDVIQ
jgi:6-phosphogluconolactonase/glucosamine-6-phosphate isomerase/deaminase